MAQEAARKGHRESIQQVINRVAEWERRAYIYLDEGSLETTRAYIGRIADLLDRADQAVTKMAPKVQPAERPVFIAGGIRRQPRGRTTEQRFWDFVEKREDGHWIWTGAMQHTMPRFALAPDKQISARRYAIQLVTGQDMARAARCCIYDRCVNPACCDGVVIPFRVAPALAAVS